MHKSLLPKLVSLYSGLLIAIMLCVLWVGGPVPQAGADTLPSASSCGISSASLPAGTVGSPYSATLQAGGGTLPYTWSIASGALPAGLSLNSITGIISGTPQSAQSYNFTVRADDSASHYCTMAVSIQVSSNTTAVNLTTVQTLMISKADTILLSAGILTAARELSSPDGRVRLSLAVGTAINMQGSSQLGAAAESNPPAATDNSTLMRAYSFIPSRATFSPAATMTLRYEMASLPTGAAESALYLAYWTGSTWERLSSTVNTTLKEVSAPVTHFTTFAIRCPAPPASTIAAVPTTTNPATVTSANATISANILGTTTAFLTFSEVVTTAATLSSADGKMILALANNTTVNLPAGSLQITAIGIASPPAAPDGSRAVEAYAFTPDNSTFAPPITLTLGYDTARLPADVPEAGLYLAVWENPDWTPLPSAVDTQAKTVTAQLSHFSTCGLLGKVTAAPVAPPAPATPPPAAISAFSTSDLTVAPEIVAAGQQVKISVRVVNGGTGEANKTVILKIDGQAQEQKDVTLPSGRSQVVTFNMSKAEPGQYTVSVDGQSTTLTVKESTKTPEGMSIPILLVIIAGGLLVIVLVIRMVVRQRSGGY